MPAYYNPYIPQQQVQPQYQQYQQYQQPPVTNQTMIWVDGEAAARAYQIPASHPVGQPLALWDNNDMVIYLKQVDNFGRPMPLKKLRYTVEPEEQLTALPGSENFVTKEDFKAFTDEIKSMIQQNHYSNQNQKQNGGKQQ